MDEDEIGRIVVDVAIQVHRELGPGLLETVYEVILADGLRARGLRVERQVPIAVAYGGRTFDEGFRADILVENKVIVELKCVEKINNAHRKQLLTYLRLSGAKLGYLLNFSEALMKGGITRTVNGLDEG
jgi:GxxExxY protein